MQNVNDSNWFGIMDISVCRVGDLIDKMTFKGQNSESESIPRYRWFAPAYVKQNHVHVIKWSEIGSSLMLNDLLEHTLSLSGWPFKVHSTSCDDFIKGLCMAVMAWLYSLVLKCLALSRGNGWGNMSMSVADSSSTKIFHLLFYTSMGKSPMWHTGSSLPKQQQFSENGRRTWLSEHWLSAKSEKINTLIGYSRLHQLSTSVFCSLLSGICIKSLPDIPALQTNSYWALKGQSYKSYS